MVEPPSAHIALTVEGAIDSLTEYTRTLFTRNFTMAAALLVGQRSAIHDRQIRHYRRSCPDFPRPARLPAASGILRS
jgi:hypothetical protein